MKNKKLIITSMLGATLFGSSLILTSKSAQAAVKETPVNGTVTVKYDGKGKVNLLNSDGAYQNQYVSKNSQWKAFTKATINNQEMYRLGSEKQWIPSKFTQFNEKGAENNTPAVNGREESYKGHVATVVYHGRGGVSLLDKNGKHTKQYVANNSTWKTLGKAVINGQTVYRIGSENQWLPAQYSVIDKAYQNPAGYYQVQYSQIKPTGKVGYTVGRGYEGIKTWLIMRRLGTFGGYANYNWATYNAVRRFQASHHLPVTGNVDVNTWQKLGFTRNSFYDIDSYIAPLGASKTQGRSAHIEAMIRQAYKYLGKPYIVGASSSPQYGTNCSGLAMQALYAGGINPQSASSINHAHPGNEWNSRNLWADRRLKTVPYSQRQRGDLIFYYQPGTRTIWHVAIYLGNNQVIESWPPRIMVQPIINGQRNIIAGVKRPFI
ncbi:NlpC/P60 family protein [Lactobacillus hominis]|uniref:C40 family peptidase n=1 Tax=Lactobacillus hominis TaxID=1203033 RepID=UPI0023EF96A1|nr:NlpC/P60 family protein [Lactobacillus hominis]